MPCRLQITEKLIRGRVQADFFSYFYGVLLPDTIAFIIGTVLQWENYSVSLRVRKYKKPVYKFTLMMYSDKK